MAKTIVWKEKVDNSGGVQRAHVSMMGSGKAGGSNTDEKRKAVIEGVTSNLLTRMRTANESSKQHAEADRAYHEGIKDTYGRTFGRVKRDQEEIKEKKKEKETLEEEKRKMDKPGSEYRKAKKESGKMEKQLDKQVNSLEKRYKMIQTKKALEEDRQKDEELKWAIAMARAFQKNGMDSDGIAAEEEKRFREEQERREREWKEVEAYGKKHRMDDKTLEKKKNQVKETRAEKENAVKAFQIQDKRYQELNERIIKLEREVSEKEAAFAKMKEYLIEEAQRSSDKLKEYTAKNREAYKENYKRYDDAAMQYYMLTRIQDQNGLQIKNIEADSGKDIQEYIGEIVSLTAQVAEAVRMLKIKPNETPEITISQKQDKKKGEIDDRNIKHHRGIRAMAITGEKMKLDSEFKDKKNVNNSTSQSLTLKEDEKDSREFLKNTADTVEIETIGLREKKKRNGKKIGSVPGVMLGNEFIPIDDTLYHSEEDESKSSKKVREKKSGRQGAVSELEEDIYKSKFFQHIYAEMIELYATYKGDAEYSSQQTQTNTKGKGEIIFDNVMGVLGGDGPEIGNESKAALLNGFVNLGTVQDLYESVNSSWAWATGKTQKLKELNAKGDEQAEKKLESEIEHGMTADILSLFNSIVTLVKSVKEAYDTIKDIVENPITKNPELYVTWADQMFAVIEKIINIAKSIFECIKSCYGIAGKVLKAADPVEKVFNIIVSSFNITKNFYEMIQNSRKHYAITKAEETISTHYEEEAKANVQVGQFLGSTRRHTGKKITENVTTIVTGSADIASEVTDPVTSTILSLSSKFIGYLSKLIANGVYKGQERKAVFTTAFPDNKGLKYMKYPEIDATLKKTVGIKSADHLATVTRIMSVIDTHALIHKAAAGSQERKLAEAAMKPLFGGEIENIPFESIMKQVGEGDNWKKKLTAALV